ncbi:hypothetical protein B0H13DRAFT_1902820 [Mycena leptocephala]|nr:hypothetical protein B0H13DRAFT_1902820 [Mycena leptocephala]
MLFAKFASLAAFVVVSTMQATPAGAVCASGQMAVGTEFLQENGATQDPNQMCNGDYDGGASVTCNSSHQPIAAVDTQGTHWTCSPTSDTSCNIGGSGGRFTVLACCNRG